MSEQIIDYALRRLEESARNGLDYDTRYWAAYLDGARAAQRACEQDFAAQNNAKDGAHP